MLRKDSSIRPAPVYFERVTAPDTFGEAGILNVLEAGILDKLASN